MIKGIKRTHRKQLVHKGECWVTELYSLHNLQGGGVDPRLQEVTKPETNLLERQSRNRLGADALLRLTLGYQLNHVWKKPKLFKGPNQTISEEHNHFTWSWRKWRLDTRNLLLSKVLLLKVCELIENTFPWLGKVTRWNNLSGGDEQKQLSFCC